MGWGVFLTDACRLEILKYDESSIFDSDYFALDHVLTRASKSPICRRAIKEVYGF
jgi:hypothetical protein